MNQTAGAAGSPKQITVRGAVFLGVGAMVGAGIFALLGPAGAVAGSAVWLSFLIGGVIAMLLGYTVAKLGARFPSSGGIITYLVEGFGHGHLVGIFGWLLYIAVMIVTAMVAVSFGSYASSLFIGDDADAIWAKLFTSIIVIAMGAINILGAKVVAASQTIIVWILLVVLGGFAIVTLLDMDPDLLARSTYPPARDILSSVALTFFAYLGFAVITFTGGNMPNPHRNLPRAMSLAIGITLVTYLAISLGVFGTLTVDEVIRYGDTALAEAARPALGDAGFTIMAIAALLATASSVNANLYTSLGVTAGAVSMGYFPEFLGKPTRLRGTRGFIITIVLTLILANLFDLTAIASLGSAVALMLFLFVGVAALRLRAETGTNPVIIVVALVSVAIVLLVFSIDTLRNEPGTFVALVVFSVAAVVIDLVWSRMRSTPLGEPVAG